MHLLYFVQYFPPEIASALSLVTDLLEGFAKYGWKVDVYTPTPTRGVTNAVRKEYSKKRKEILYNGNVIVHRLPLYREGKGFMQRTIRYTLFSLQCLIIGLFSRADAIFTGNGPPTQGIIAALIHKLTKKKVIFNPQDLFPDSLIIAGMASEKSTSVKIGRKIERFAYDNSDVIITITDDMAKNIRTKTKNKAIHVVRNWIDTEQIIPVERKDNTLFDELYLPRNKFYVVYAGNLGKVQGVEIIIEAAELLKENNKIRFVVFGNGSEEEKIKALITEKKLTNIKLFPLLPADRISEVYSLGDVCLITCKKGLGRAGMPSKTWTIMATGTPIIASFDLGGEMEKVITEAGCGYCIEAGNSNKLAEVILQLSELSTIHQKIKQLGTDARKYAVNNVSKENAVQQYIKFIENK